MKKFENALEKIHTFLLRFEAVNGFPPTRKEIFDGVAGITWFNIDRTLPKLRKLGMYDQRPYKSKKKKL